MIHGCMYKLYIVYSCTSEYSFPKVDGDFDYKQAIHLHHTPKLALFLFLSPFLLTSPVLKELRKLYCTANAVFAITALTIVASSPKKLSENTLHCFCVEIHNTLLEYLFMQNKFSQ